MDVAALVMVQNDAYYLPYVLESVAGVFERMVIYDIGSTDHTKEIIQWYVDKEKGDYTDFFVRYLPNCDPHIQGALRNAMIAEARANCYWLLDGDEILKPEEASHIPYMARNLNYRHTGNPRTRYGVVRRVEVSPDLRQKYSEERTHHRLYTNDAVWTSTHPGEEPLYAQNWKTEVNLQDKVAVLHMHNTLRSPKEEEAIKRMQRKDKKTYRPGELIDFDILKEYPILSEQIHVWPVSPVLKEIQDAN